LLPEEEPILKKKRKRPAPGRPILALLRRRIKIGVEPDTHDSHEIDAAVPVSRWPAWVQRDLEVLSELDAMLWSCAVLYGDRDEGWEPMDRAMLRSWERLDDRIAAGTLPRSAWEAHRATVYAWERHQIIGLAMQRSRAAQRVLGYLHDAGLAARRARASRARNAYRNLAAPMIKRGMTRASAAKFLADHPPSHEHRLAPSTIRRFIADLT
jgi:hypothetical protein